MYWLMITSLVVAVAALLAARLRPRIASRVGFPALAVAAVFGLLSLRDDLPPRPVLGEWSDDAVAARLSQAVISRVPKGQKVLILNWRRDMNGKRTREMERRLVEAGLTVHQVSPPAVIPAASGKESLRISMEEGGAPPDFLALAHSQHPDCRAMVVLLNFSTSVPVSLAGGLPLLFLDDLTEGYFPWREPGVAPRLGAAVVAKPAASWKAREALDAGPGKMFDLLFTLVEGPPGEHP